MVKHLSSPLSVFYDMQPFFAKRNAGVAAIALLSLTPVVLWLLADQFAFRFSSPDDTFRSLGQITGLVGIALFAINLILSARVRWMEPFFGALDRMYRIHVATGALALAVLMMHPILLAVRYALISGTAAKNFLLPQIIYWPVFYGRIALLVMTVLILASYVKKIPYHIWKWLHKGMAVAYVFALMHLLQVNSDTAVFLPLRYYLVALMLLGLLAIVYRVFLSSVLAVHGKYTVKTVSVLPGKILEIEVESAGKPVEFSAGQYVFLQFISPGVSREAHPFSIASENDGKTMRFGVKSLGDYTKKLSALKPGAHVKIEGPYGAFTLASATKRTQIWIAGGIGITPFLGMADEAAKRCDRKIDCYYCVRNAGEAVYKEELEARAKQCANFKVHTWCSDKDGNIDIGFIAKNREDLGSADFFLCGPPAMMRAFRAQLLGRGVPEAQIHTEEFAFMEEKAFRKSAVGAVAAFLLLTMWYGIFGGK